MRKAVWACLPFAAGISVCKYLLPAEYALPAAVLCVFFSLPGFLFHDKRRLCILLSAYGAAAGCVCFWVQQRFVLRPAEAWVGETVSVSARVTDWPDVYDGSAYVTVRLTQPGMPRVRCRLVSYVEGELDGLVPGDELSGEVRIMSAAIRNGEEVDTYSSQGIFLRAVCTQEPEINGRWRGSFLYLPRALAHAIQQLTRRVFPSDAAPFMTALLTGEKASLYEDEGRYYSLSQAGLAHIVAVSGMHISYLLGFFFLLAGRRRGSVLLSFPILLFFAAMMGFSPSVTRAMFMQMCLYSAPLFQREEDSLTSLSVILALMLLLNPSAVASVSLHLSFASMAGIWLVAGRLYNKLWGRFSAGKLAAHRPFKQILAFVAATVSSSFAAQLFTLPLCALHFGSISTVSPVSNVLALWMVSILYIGGFIAVALGALFPAAGLAAGGVLAWGVRYIYFLCDALSYLPCESVYTSNPLMLLWLGFVYALLFIVWLAYRRGRGFRPVAPLCLALITLYAGALAVRLTWRDELQLTALDVGQGESVAVTCGPRAILVDCGGSVLTRDAGEAAVRFFMGRQRSRLDALILTHLHADHVNGVSRLLAQLDVDVLYMPAQPDEDGYLPAILSAAARQGTRVEYVTENILLRIGEMDVTVWAPLLPGEENENCLTVMTAQDAFEVLITGDNYSQAERLLAANYTLPDTEVLVVGHHGSRTSTCAPFLEAARPDVAIISVGYNTYGHPAPEVLSRLEEYAVTVYRTDLDGNITVRAGRK